MATKLTDGKKTIKITMSTWAGNGWTPDWSADFFAVGGLHYDEDRDAYTVEDLSYCIEQAEDWKHSRGDYADDEPNENNEVFVEDCDEDEKTLYFFDDWSLAGDFFGSFYPHCLTADEIDEWNKECNNPDATDNPVDLWTLVHEATAEEIERFGTEAE